MLQKGIWDLEFFPQVLVESKIKTQAVKKDWNRQLTSEGPKTCPTHYENKKPD